MIFKRVTLFSGHYGSGKTNVAVNCSISLAKAGKPVSIYDLDIVNPYFRTVDAEKSLSENGVELVVSPFAETNVDIPAMNASSYKMIDDLKRFAVVDLGGDDRGALALGRFSDRLKEENDYDLLLVVNMYRPETRDINGVVRIKNEIEYASRMKFTGIVNNSNLGTETTVQTVIDSLDFIDGVSNGTGLPIKFTSVRKDLADSLTEKIQNVLPIELIKYGSWL